MAASRPPVPQQEALLEMTASGIMHVRTEALEHTGAVDIVSRNIGLINCLGHLAHVRELTGLAYVGPDGIRDRYGQGATPIIIRGEARRKEELKAAKWEFARATGMYALIDSGQASKTEAQRITDISFKAFQRKFRYAADSHQAAVEYRKKLEAQIKRVDATEH